MMPFSQSMSVSPSLSTSESALQRAAAVSGKGVEMLTFSKLFGIIIYSTIFLYSNHVPFSHGAGCRKQRKRQVLLPVVHAVGGNARMKRGLLSVLKEL